MIVYEYRSRRNRTALQEWQLQGRNEGAFDAALDRLAMFTLDFALDSMLARIGGKLLKMRVAGDIPLRPRFCRGLEHPDSDVTFLLGVSKKGKIRTPKEPDEKAHKRIEELESGIAAVSILREDCRE